MTASPDALLLDVKQVAALTNISQRTIYRLADRGAMPRPTKIGALVRWNRVSLEEWVAGGCKPMRRA